MAGPVMAVVSGQTKAPSPARPGTPGDPGDFRRANVQVCTLSISSEPGPLNGSQDGVLEAGRGPCPTEADLAIRNLKSFQKQGLFFQKSASISPAVPNWHVPSRMHLRGGVRAKPHRSLPLWLPTPAALTSVLRVLDPAHPQPAVLTGVPAAAEVPGWRAVVTR